MKKTMVICLILAHLLVIVGCDSQKNITTEQSQDDFKSLSPSFDGINLSDIDVSFKSLNYTNQSMNFDINVISGSRSGDKFIYVESIDPQPNSYSYSLLDDSGQLLWEYQVSTDGEVIFVTERTLNDELIMSYSTLDDLRLESYTLNSADPLELQCDKALHQKLLLESEGESVEYSAAEEVIKQQLQSELEVYLANSGSLMNNNYGFFVSDILENHEIVEVLPELQTYQKRSKEAQEVCDAAATCALLKCLLGGLSNPVCAACTGVAIGCKIEDWFF